MSCVIGACMVLWCGIWVVCVIKLRCVWCVYGMYVLYMWSVFVCYMCVCVICICKYNHNENRNTTLDIYLYVFQGRNKHAPNNFKLTNYQSWIQSLAMHLQLCRVRIKQSQALMGKTDREWTPASQKRNWKKEPELGELWYLRTGGEHWRH